jgi:hypothetical protein
MEQTEWVMPLRDGTEVKIPANKVSNINKKIENKEPIYVANRTVMPYELAGGPRLHIPEVADPDLLTQAAVAFGEPVLNDNGEVQCIWVKETVSTKRWNSYYSQFANYYKLGNSYDDVVVAYRLPVHLAVDNSLTKCNPPEVQTLESKLANS